VLPLTKQLSVVSGSLWGKTLQGARAQRIEMLLLHEFHERKFILPDKLSARDRAAALDRVAAAAAAAAAPGSKGRGKGRAGQAKQKGGGAGGAEAGGAGGDGVSRSVIAVSGGCAATKARSARRTAAADDTNHACVRCVRPGRRRPPP
jgi:hypothetical protein